ncbi:hypothetical protein [Streptomyces arboris]|uniref:hypothetical protein n=1 Tax=Streptomyces arboris TaxID=2600619 RepID=UPI003BF4B422
MSLQEWHIMSSPPIDSFEGMTPLADYLSPAVHGSYSCPQDVWFDIEQTEDRLKWAKGALGALESAAAEVDWDGDFRGTPYVGALPWPAPVGDEAARYLLVKQDNNGTCFVISAFPIPAPLFQTVYATTVVRPERPTHA